MVYENTWNLLSILTCRIHLNILGVDSLFRNIIGPTAFILPNSLGLQPKSIKTYIEQELDEWARLEWKDISTQRIHGFLS